MGEAGAEEPRAGGLRARGEEALGDLAQALLDNPLFGQALSRAMGAGERAAAAQRTAMGALNIPPASEVERLQQRLRSLSARLDDVEDRLDDIIDELAAMRRRAAEPTPQADEDVPATPPSPQADEDVPATPSGP